MHRRARLRFPGFRNDFRRVTGAYQYHIAPRSFCGICLTRDRGSGLPNRDHSAIVVRLKRFLISLLAGVLIWIAICLVAIAHQPSHAGSLVATVEIILALVVAILACVVVRTR